MIIIPTGRLLLAVACPLFVLQQYVYIELPVLEELIARAFGFFRVLRHLVIFGLTS
jgi:hypothetical protein